MESKPLDEWTMRQILGDDLLKDEKILWVGQPDPSVIFSRGDIFAVPFSLLWGGFAIFWEAAALGIVFGHPAAGRPDPFFALFGIPFVLIGLYMIFGRFIFKRWKKENTYYAVTEKRVIVLIKLWRRTLQAVRIASIPTLNKTMGAGGTGTIIFGNTTYATRYGNSGMEFLGGQFGSDVPAFYDIKGVDTVYEVVNRLMDGEAT